MFNKERIENLEKRISRIEQIQNAECNSAQMERELFKQVLDISRDKKYLEMENISILQETRKIIESLNERIKKLKQRLKKSSIRYRELKDSIPHNGLKSV